MRIRHIIIALLAVASLTLAMSAAGCGADTVGGINLKGEARYTVGDQVYAVTESGFGDGIFELSLERRSPAGSVAQGDADAVAAVDGIALESGDGEQVPLGTTRLRPDAGGEGKGYVVLVFAVDNDAFFSQTWTLVWPGHEPLVVSNPGLD